MFAFLVESFLPHAQAEETAVYPRVATALGAARATDPMAWDHAEVRRLALKLAALRERLVHSYFGPDQVRAVRSTLYELHAILEQHLTKEDEIYLALLDRRIGAGEGISLAKEVADLEKRATALTPVAAST